MGTGKCETKNDKGAIVPKAVTVVRMTSMEPWFVREAGLCRGDSKYDDATSLLHCVAPSEDGSSCDSAGRGL